MFCLTAICSNAFGANHQITASHGIGALDCTRVRHSGAPWRVVATTPLQFEVSSKPGQYVSWRFFSWWSLTRQVMIVMIQPSQVFNTNWGAMLWSTFYLPPLTPSHSVFCWRRKWSSYCKMPPLTDAGRTVWTPCFVINATPPHNVDC